jgi:hypothetical protein
VEVWWDELDRVRIDQGGTVTVTDGDATLQYSPHTGLMRSGPDRFATTSFPNWLWSPRALIAALEIHEVTTTTDAHERTVWRVHADAVPSSQLGLPTALLVLGERLALDVDRATGIIVGSVGSLTDGTVVSRVAWEEFEPGAAVADEVFDRALPPDARTRTETDRVVDHFRVRGDDVSDVDRDRPASEVFQELERRHRGKSHHVPIGGPPPDQATARRHVVTAVTRLADTDDSGDDLVHVQAGAGLGPVVAMAMERHPGARIQVGSVQFLSAHEAIAVAAIRSDARPLLPHYEFRVVDDGGRWQVSRHSFSSLMSLAGVPCPPPARE